MEKKIYFIYECQTLFHTVIQEKLVELKMEKFCTVEGNVVTFTGKVNAKLKNELLSALEQHGIVQVENDKSSLVDKIKNCLKNEIAQGGLRNKKMSVLLSEKMGYSYPYLSAHFSKETFTTIENFCIFMKIETVKTLLTTTNHSLSEIAHRLDYSSSAHLSRQFKSITGLTVTKFLQLVAIREQEER